VSCGSFVKIVGVNVCVEGPVEVGLVLSRGFVNIPAEVAACNYVLQNWLLVYFSHRHFSGSHSLLVFHVFVVFLPGTKIVGY
jgi:hypothetical protein